MDPERDDVLKQAQAVINPYMECIDNQYISVHESTAKFQAVSLSMLNAAGEEEREDYEDLESTLR